MPDVGTRKLRLYVDDTDYTASVSNATITSAETDSDFVSFADAAAGGLRDYALHLVMKQNTSADSLWDLIWSRPGEEVTFSIWPNGEPSDGEPTADQPEITGVAVVQDPDGDLLGGEANPSTTARMTVEVDWLCTEKPIRDTGI